MLSSACFLVFLFVWTGPRVARGVDHKTWIENLQGSYFKLYGVFQGLEKQNKDMMALFGKVKIVDERLTEEHHTAKEIRGSFQTLRPQLNTLGNAFDNLNRSISREKEKINQVDVNSNGGFKEHEDEIESFSGILEKYIADVDQRIKVQKQTCSEELRQEAERQAEATHAFRQQLWDYEDAREQKTKMIKELMQTVNSTIAALRARDQASHDRAASLQVRVQQLIQEVQGIFIRSREQGSRLDTANASSSGDRQHVTNFRTSFNTHLQQFNNIQQMLATIQASVAELQTRKGQVQGYTSHLNEHIQNRQSRLDDDDQQRATLLQQIRDLRNDHGQDNNAIGLDLNDIEATLDTLEADAEADDSLTQVESTIRNIQANITALNSKIDQNQNHQEMIQQQQSNQQQSIETEGGAIQEHTQAQETFDEQLESYNTIYQERVSTEEERLQTMETQVGDSTEILTTLQGIVDVLSTNVEGAEQQFAQYSSPAAISEGFASLEQSIQDVEDTQATFTSVEQQLTDSMSETDGRFEGLESDILDQEVSMEQAQANLQLAAQAQGGDFDVSSTIASLSTLVTTNTQQSDELSLSTQEVLRDRQLVQAQQQTLEEQIDAIPVDQAQQNVAAVFEDDIRELDLKLDNMEASVDQLEETANALASSSESTFEMLEGNLDTITTQLSNQQGAINALLLRQEDGLENTVTTLQQNVDEITSSTNGLFTSVADLEQALQGSSVDHFESGTWELPEQRNFWGQSQTYDSKQTNTINFSSHFRRRPVVYVSISKWDMGSGYTNSFSVRVYNVEPSGFSMTYGRDSDGQFYAGTVEWIALGNRY
ncbi:uncharacterized protein LOC144867559 [Branchiostoma floridae x Branchiostoma japonicum]